MPFLLKKTRLQTTITQVNRNFDSDNFTKIWSVDSSIVFCF